MRSELLLQTALSILESNKDAALCGGLALNIWCEHFDMPTYNTFDIDIVFPKAPKYAWGQYQITSCKRQISLDCFHNEIGFPDEKPSICKTEINHKGQIVTVIDPVGLFEVYRYRSIALRDKDIRNSKRANILIQRLYGFDYDVEKNYPFRENQWATESYAGKIRDNLLIPFLHSKKETITEKQAIKLPLEIKNILPSQFERYAFMCLYLHHGKHIYNADFWRDCNRLARKIRGNLYFGNDAWQVINIYLLTAGFLAREVYLKDIKLVEAELISKLQKAGIGPGLVKIC